MWFIHCIKCRWKSVWFLRINLIRKRRCWGRFLTAGLAPELRRQLEHILTAGCVRSWCATPLGVKGNLGPASSGAESCVLSVSVTALFPPWGTWEPSAPGCLCTPLVDAGERVVSQVDPVQELCQQEKEAEESLSLIAVSCVSHKGWLASPQEASKRKTSALRGLKKWKICYLLCNCLFLKKAETSADIFAFPCFPHEHLTTSYFWLHKNCPPILMCLALRGGFMNNFLSFLLPRVTYTCTGKRTGI